VEQLWDLPAIDLDSLAISLEQAYKNSKGKSFLVQKTTKDKTIKLQFDIALDILSTKMEEAAVIREATEKKEHNQKILGLIKKKKDSDLEGLSIEELEEQLR